MRHYPMPADDIPVATAILAKGAYPSSLETRSILVRTHRVVCCDGAVEEFVGHGGIPWAVVGDCDSIGESFAESLRDRIFTFAEQQTNDLNKAVRFCLSEGMNDITIFGATGLRDDHSLANIGVMVEYCRQARIEIVTDFGVFDAISEDASFGSFEGQQVSLFTLSDDTPVSVEGLAYLPPGNRLRGLWQGLSNRSTGDRFTVRTDGLVLVFRNFAGCK